MLRTKSFGPVISILFVGVIILVLLLIGPTQTEAVNVTATPSDTDVVPGNTVTVDVTVLIQSNERIPIQDQRLKIYSDAECTTELTASPYSSPRSMSFVSATPSPGYGYGTLYGFDPIVSQGFSFGYGYGYGYGYGGSVTLTYRCTIDTTGWAADQYYIKGEIDCGTHVYVSSASSFVVAQNWDVNYDGCINVQDVTVIGQNWMQTGDPHWIRADVNEDGVINVQDVTVVGQHWLEGC